MTDATTVLEPAPPARSQSFAGQLWGQFRKHTGGLIGLIVFIVIVVSVYLGPLIHTVDPNKLNIRDKNQGPSWVHPFGTDNLGHDLFAQVLAGGQISLAVGITAMLIALIVGTVIGMLAGYFKSIDGILMRITDLFLALPILPLLLVITMLFRDSLRSAFGPNTGIFLLIVVVIGVTSWMHTARIVRGDVLTIKSQEFVLAAKSSGMREYRILLKHILPNVLSSVMVSATLGIASAIITESALSFLGLGFPSDFPTWGRLLFDGVNFLQITPARAIWPGLAISLTVLSVNYIGDGIRDALDPRSLKR